MNQMNKIQEDFNKLLKELPDLRLEFQRWLVQRGLKTKTGKKRPSTIYEYTRRLDALSEFLYAKNDWNKLGSDIYLLRLFHFVYDRKKIRDFVPLKKILEDLNTYAKITFEERYVKPKRFSLYAKNLSTHILDVHKNHVAVEVFYKFIESFSSTPKVEKIISSLGNYIGNKNVKITNIPKGRNFYFALKHNFKVIRTAKTVFTKYLEYKMQPATSSSAGKIIDYKKNAFFNVKTTKYILDCSNSTLQRLSSKGKRGFTLHKTGEKGYIVRILNRYLKKHHHKAESREASVSSSGSYKWLTGAEAAHELNCSQSKIKILRRKGKITYIQNSPRIIRYCPEDIKKMKQI